MLDVLHPEVPVLDLIDLPGIVAVDVPGVTPAGKVDAVERVISAQVGLVRRGLSACACACTRTLNLCLHQGTEPASALRRSRPIGSMA